MLPPTPWSSKPFDLVCPGGSPPGPTIDAIQVRLFDRIRQRLILTEAGSTYAQDVRKLLSGFEQSTLQVMAYGSGGQAGTINLGVFSTFSMKWPIPRLEDYRATRPNTVISCYARPQPFSFDEDPLDAAIHYGEPIWPGASVEPLFGEQLIPVCSPTLPGRRELKTPQDMMKFPLLHEVTRPWSWKHWFEQQGVTIGSPLLGPASISFPWWHRRPRPAWASASCRISCSPKRSSQASCMSR